VFWNILQSLFEIFIGIGYAAGPLLGSALYGVCMKYAYSPSFIVQEMWQRLWRTLEVYN
jgi:hypothetical protein